MTEQLGRYVMVSELGRGAMGMVYKAIDPLIDRPVAIKTINLNDAREERQEYEDRFYQEARAAGQLSHRNIVTIYDIGRAGDVAYIAMEFIEGSELRGVLDEIPVLPVAKAVDITLQVAQGLAYAHEHAVVHRDVKPSNVMIAKNGDVKIMDFGIARMSAAAVRTQSGMVFGTPKYMSPEQVLGKRADPRSDIFSVGVMLYEMLTGRAPFAGDTIDIVAHHTLHTIPPPPSAVNPNAPVVLDYIVAKAMAKRPEDRYQTALELASDLDEFSAALADSGWRPPAGAQSAPEPEPVPAITPLAEAAEAAATQEQEDAENPGGAPPPMPSLGVSSQFDSFVATIRMAAMTFEEGALENFTAGLDVTPASTGGKTGDTTWPLPARADAPQSAGGGERATSRTFLRTMRISGTRRNFLWMAVLLLAILASLVLWMT
ncbi:MAG TPA: serine/threonine-protein kinase [Gallionellaceae bacterium]|nr:serine/threonine-protein kinase [Gallionellaceae bacterium]